jgi:5'-3' exonuclease
VTVSLIDGDIVSYSCAAYNESFGWDACKEDIDQLMKRILETTGATDYQCFISGSNNFRYRIYNEYKANRKGKPDPIYRSDSNAYLVTAYGAKVTDGYEADDGIGIAATTHSDAIICSIDKDLKQIPGNHYNWRKNEFDTVSHLDGLRSFWRSACTGDRVDNIHSGLHRMGPVTASKIIDDLENEEDMVDAVSALYGDRQSHLLLNLNCLYILREEGILWEDTLIGKDFILKHNLTPMAVSSGLRPQQKDMDDFL